MLRRNTRSVVHSNATGCRCIVGMLCARTQHKPQHAQTAQYAARCFCARHDHASSKAPWMHTTNRTLGCYIGWVATPVPFQHPSGIQCNATKRSGPSQPTRAPQARQHAWRVTGCQTSQALAAAFRTSDCFVAHTYHTYTHLHTLLVASCLLLLPTTSVRSARHQKADITNQAHSA